jgi:[ribosomal protein S18]-alanine N-acetyltransferase
MNHGSDNLSVEAAHPGDSLPIHELARNSRIDAWSAADYSDEMSRPDSFVLTAKKQDRLVGFLVARTVPGVTEHPDAELYNIGIAGGHKRQGIGTLLLFTLLEKLAEKRVRNLWLEVRESNSEAISFYSRYGFTAEVTRPNFYSNPSENALVMRLQIPSRTDVSEV